MRKKKEKSLGGKARDRELQIVIERLCFVIGKRERGPLQTKVVLRLVIKLRVRHSLKISPLNLKQMSGLKIAASPR